MLADTYTTVVPCKDDLCLLDAYNQVGFLCDTVSEEILIASERNIII